MFLYVWKIVVFNIFCILCEILFIFFGFLLGFLVSMCVDKRMIVVRILGDFVWKLGEKIFFEIIFIFEEGLRF